MGASGKVGRLVTTKALQRGHSVVAFVHHNKSFMSDPKLTVHQGDIHDAAAVAGSIIHSQAVISTLGSWGTSTKDIVASGMRSVIPAMQQQGINRIVSLTGTEAYDQTDTPNLLRKLAHSAASLGAGKILRDGETHIKLLRASNLDWTVLRSPVMTNRDSVSYRLTLTPLPPWQTISRQALAKAIIEQIEGPGYMHAAPFVYQR